MNIISIHIISICKKGIELFEELVIDENGYSRWVFVNEFVGKYQGLQLLSGAGWSRDDSTFVKRYKIERDKTSRIQDI